MTAGAGVGAAAELLAPMEGGRALRLLVVLGGLAMWSRVRCRPPRRRPPAARPGWRARPQWAV